MHPRSYSSMRFSSTLFEHDHHQLSHLVRGKRDSVAPTLNLS